MSPQDDLRIIALPHVLSMEKGRIDVQRPAGGNLNDLIRSIGWVPDSLSARVFIDGEYVKDAAWEYTIPHAGQSVIVRAIPMGGEEGGKDVMRIGAMVAVLALAIAAPYMAPVLLAGWVGVAATAAISIVGSLAVTAQIPPALPRLRDQREVLHG